MWCHSDGCFMVIAKEMFLLSGGHGRALAGVYLEETCVGAAEAQRSTPETGLRGAHPTVWVSVLRCIPSQSLAYPITSCYAPYF